MFPYATRTLDDSVVVIFFLLLRHQIFVEDDRVSFSRKREKRNLGDLVRVYNRRKLISKLSKIKMTDMFNDRVTVASRKQVCNSFTQEVARESFLEM